MNISLLKKLLPGLIPLFVFIIADEIWGTEAGLYAAVAFGTAEMIFYYIRDSKIDRFILLDILLLIILGGVSLALENEIFFKIKPALIEAILLIIIAFSLWGPQNISLAMTKRYTGELRLEERTMRLNLKIMLAITAFHIMLVLYSAWYMPATAWTFISGGLLYIIFGVWFVSIWGLNLFKKAKYREEE